MLLIQNGLKTHNQAAREIGGGDWDENVELLTDENQRLAEAKAGLLDYPFDLTKEEEDEADGQSGRAGL